MVTPFFLAAASLVSQFQTIAVLAQGQVGVAIRVVETGETVGLQRDQHFPMQSVYKLPIAMAILNDIDRGELRLDQPIKVAKNDLVPKSLHSPLRDQHPNGDFDVPLRDVLRYAVSESDGTASDVLLRLLGGPAKAHEYVQSIGIHEIVIATTELEMSRAEDVQYRNWSTPDAMLQLLEALHQGKGISPAHRTLLLQWMTDTPTGPKRLKALLPTGSAIAHKTGTSLTVDGLTRATNDVGIITLPTGKHLLIAVFVSDSKADQDTRESVIAKLALAAASDRH